MSDLQIPNINAERIKSKPLALSEELQAKLEQWPWAEEDIKEKIGLRPEWSAYGSDTELEELAHRITQWDKAYEAEIEAYEVNLFAHLVKLADQAPEDYLEDFIDFENAEPSKIYFPKLQLSGGKSAKRPVNAYNGAKPGLGYLSGSLEAPSKMANAFIDQYRDEIYRVGNDWYVQEESGQFSKQDDSYMKDVIAMDAKNVAAPDILRNIVDSNRAKFTRAAEDITEQRSVNAIYNQVFNSQDLVVKADVLDSAEDQIQTPQGSWNFWHKQIEEVQGVVNTLQTAVAPKQGSCREFYDWLVDRFSGDEEMANYMLNVAASALFGRNINSDFYFLYGPKGSGKSSFMRVIMGLIGTDDDSGYAAITDAENWTTARSDAHSEWLAALKGKRLVYSEEATDMMHFNTSLLNKVTSGTPIRARGMYAKGGTFSPQFTLFFDGNDRPSVTGEGIWRRLNLIEFTNPMILGNEEDDSWPEKIVAKEGAALLHNLLIRARKIMLEGHISVPEKVVRATEEYQEEQDVMGQFFSEYLTPNPNAEAPCSDVIAQYREYCKKIGETPESQHKFGKHMRDAGYSSKLLKRGGTSRKHYIGVALREGLPYLV